MKASTYLHLSDIFCQAYRFTLGPPPDYIRHSNNLTDTIPPPKRMRHSNDPTDTIPPPTRMRHSNDLTDTKQLADFLTSITTPETPSDSQVIRWARHQASENSRLTTRLLEAQHGREQAELLHQKLQVAIDAALECAICKDRLEDPILLQCGHTFCRGCLEGWANGRNLINCPYAGCAKASWSIDWLERHGTRVPYALKSVVAAMKD